MNGSSTPTPDLSTRPDRRSRTFAAAHRHSGFVRLLKVAIPLGSLAAVGLVAFVSLYNPFGRLPGLTLGPISLSGSKIAMESPRLTGFRKDNRPYEVTATAAYQDIRKPNVIELSEMKAKLAIDENGTVARLVSKTGILDTGKDHLDLAEDIRIWTERGEEVLLKSASIDLKGGAAVTRDPVKVVTPTLRVEANGAELSDNGKTIAFTGRVRTVMTPAGDRRPSRAGAAPSASSSTKTYQADASGTP